MIFSDVCFRALCRILSICVRYVSKAGDAALVCTMDCKATASESDSP